INIQGNEKLAKALQRSKKGLPQLLQKLGWASAYMIERSLKLRYSTGPLYALSGSAGLEGSVHAFLKVQAGRVRAGAGTKKFYAKILEHGAVIVPKTKLALKFQTREGEWVVTQRVVIPPFQAAQMAYHETEPHVRRLWAKGLKGLAVLKGA
ncbi:hypothetical protein KAW64_17055, partial [bacterium]|nr:hypothetical protein [bacterium]